ncbi:GNAT family N-acetyltransferase [Actinomadura flavalba]|uniref:GNAT family N-acetyltransferase n=1 Tax=Actinomadura flavalba TaxID=1120938 RepID=UPI000476979C|nr:N-acetyltransferase [Actinomadura flavalba]
MSTSTVQVKRGLPDPARPAAAELYWEGFARKLSPVLGGARPTDLIAAGLAADQVLCAWDGGDLLGIACLQPGTAPALRLDRRRLTRAFGPLRGGWRLLLSYLLESDRPGPDELLLDTLAVSGRARGRGVGTALLDGTVAEARRIGRRYVRLEVVDTNPRAKALYERYGFERVKTVRTPYLKRLMGFGAVDALRYDVTGSD